MSITFEITRREDDIEINGTDYHVTVNTVYRGKSSLVQFRITISRVIASRLSKTYSIQDLIHERVYWSHRAKTYKKLVNRYEKYLKQLLGTDYTI